VHDIRYSPLQFDGWNQRHWTLPFEGERFSIVWFTPHGCEALCPTPAEVAAMTTSTERAAAAAEAAEVEAGAELASGNISACTDEPVAGSATSRQPRSEKVDPTWSVTFTQGVQKDQPEMEPRGDTIERSTTLRHSVSMPRLGLGTFHLRGPCFKQVFCAALRAGVRLVDTAASYRNEEELGQVLREEVSLRGSRAVVREDVFVTSKLRPQDHGYSKTLAACRASLIRLGLDYLDCFLIHWPGAAKLPPTSEQHQVLRVESWRAMEELLADGHVRSIGVSNFTVAHLEHLLARCRSVTPEANEMQWYVALGYSLTAGLWLTCSVRPALNQVEFHPLVWAEQRPLLEYCTQHGIIVQVRCQYLGRFTRAWRRQR
jgi:diketogulonate reductase-like aldo/keto reductase